jgi:tetratricopeptide (TPR) repeat protein
VTRNDFSKSPSGRHESSDAVEEAQGELSLARVAIAEGDLRHAANHVAGAISHAPALPEVHELLTTLAARSGDGGLGLFPIQADAYVGTVVAHAHLLAPNDPARALHLLAQATEFDPSKPWADAAWVGACRPEGIAADSLVRIFVTVIKPLTEPVSDELRRVNQIWLDLARRAVAGHPHHAVLHGVCSAVARRLGDTAVAVDWGRRGVELEANKLTFTWYAYALRTDGRLDEAVEVMHQARRQYPLDIDLSADVSSWLADAGRLDEALGIIEEAMRIDPTYDCGVHTAHRLRFWRDGDAATHLVALSDFMRGEAQPSHEHTDLADCCRGRAWLGQPAWASEAVINAMRQIPAEERHQGSMHVSQMEVPSALAMVSRVWPGLALTFPEPTPDLITPLRDGPSLWRFDGTRLVPAIPPPSVTAATLIAQTVTPDWPHPVAAYDRALPLGELAVADLLAALVHPPARPAQYADEPDDAWVRAVQAFICLGVLHAHELRGAPGDTRRPRELLTALAYGVEDWITEAALFGLAVAAWVDPECRQEVARTVQDRYVAAVRATEQHVVTILPGLSHVVLIVPGIEESQRSYARNVLAADDEDSPVDG